MDEESRHHTARTRFGLTTLGVIVAGLGGYIGFVTFAEFPSAGMALLILASATGFAAFFSPCSFPLLLTFLARKADHSTGAAAVSALRVGVGAAALLALLATLIASLGDAVASVLAFDRTGGRAFRAVIGLSLVYLGLRQSRLIAGRIRVFDGVAAAAARAFDPARLSKRAARDFLYGFGYLLAGFG